MENIMSEGGKTMNSEVKWHVTSITEGEETLSVLFPAEVLATERQDNETVKSNGEE